MLFVLLAGDEPLLSCTSQEPELLKVLEHDDDARARREIASQWRVRRCYLARSVFVARRTGALPAPPFSDFLIVNGGSHAERPARARAGPTPLWGKRGGVEQYTREG